MNDLQLVTTMFAVLCIFAAGYVFGFWGGAMSERKREEERRRERAIDKARATLGRPHPPEAWRG